MKEFESSFTAINNGLRPFKLSGVPGLMECFNVMPMGEEGSFPHEPVTLIEPLLPSCGDWEVTHPWPQIVFGDYYVLGFAIADTDDCSTGIPLDDQQVILYEISKSGEVWTVDPMKALGYASQINQVDMIDFGEFYAVSYFGYNGLVPVVRSIYRDPGVVKPNTQIYSCGTSTVPNFITGCNYNGQAVVGGISSNEAFWQDCGLNSVGWSGIGSFNFLPSNDIVAGYMNMDWDGIVYKIRKLGNKVIVFGSGGITELIPVSEPVVTFGKKNISLIGVTSGNHISGDENILCWIDINNDLWMMDASLKSKKLGYREWFSELGDNVLMSYVPEKKRFFISDGKICFVLTEGGLYSCHQIITSVGVRDDIMWGLFDDKGDTTWRVETDEIDFKQRALKTLQFVEVHGVDEITSIKVRFKSSLLAENYSETDWKNVNPQGILYCAVSGSDFRISVRGMDYLQSTGIVNDIKLRLKQTDKRNIRGMYSADKTFA